MVNTAALFGVLGALARPGLIVPHVVVRSVASLDWARLRANGVTRVVFDKDNCLTKPRFDDLEPSLSSAWEECIDTFGQRNVLIVSNSAGSSDDIGGLGAENLSRTLGVPVLAHASKKPSGRCVRQILSALGEGERILVVGDRITTDTVLAHRLSDAMASRWARDKGGTQGEGSNKPYAIAALTTQLWAKERFGIQLLRRVEDRTRERLIRRGYLPGGRGKGKVDVDWQGIAERIEPPPSAAIVPASPSSDTALARQPTVLEFVASQQALPPAFAKVLRALQSIMSLAPLAWLGRMVREGWALIGRGTREGLPRSLGGEGEGAEVLSKRGAARRRRGKRGLEAFLSIGQQRPRSSRISSAESAQAQQSSSYSTDSSGQTQQPRPQAQGPPKMPLRNWLAAFAALLIMPLGYLGGQALWEYRHADDASLAAAKRVEELRAMSHDSREEKEQRERDKMRADLEAVRFGLERELKGVRDKLGRVEDRGEKGLQIS